MPHQSELKQWNEEVSNHISHLNNALVKVLACYAFGMVLRRYGRSAFCSVV